MSDKPQTPDEKLQKEFNRWAAEGEGPKMERHHLDITEKTIRLMNLRPGERVLDLGCGSGWATRLLARLVGDGPEGFGQVVGLDVSDEMVRQAREASKDFENMLYVWGSAMQIPWEENFFDKVLSVESFYYYPDQDRALMELFRVMAPRGRLFILINLYKDNVYSLQWVDKLKVPVHVRSSAEYVELLRKHAFENVEARRIPDDTPTPDDYKTKSFNTLEDLRAFKREGALLLMASKPDLRTPAPGYTIYCNHEELEDPRRDSRIGCPGERSSPAPLDGNLNRVVIPLLVFTPILDRAHSPPILGVMDVDATVHVAEVNLRAAVAQFSPHVVSYHVPIDAQPKVVMNSPRNRTRFYLGVGIRRDRQIDRTVDRVQFHRFPRQLPKLGFQMAVNGREFRSSRQTLSFQSPVDAGCTNFTAHSVHIQLPVNQFDFVQLDRPRHGQRVFHARRIVV